MAMKTLSPNVPDVVDDDDVRVLQLRDGLRLAQQARLAVGRVAARAQELDGDLAIELGIVRRVDLAHAAAPQQADEDEAPDALAALESPSRSSELRPAAEAAAVSSTPSRA